MDYAIPLILLLILLATIKEITALHKMKREHEEEMREFEELEYSYGTGTFERPWYGCPNCAMQQKDEIYTCMSCGHVVKEYNKFGGWQPQCEPEDIEPDGAQMAHDEMENS